MNRERQMNMRKQMFDGIEKKLQKDKKPEDLLFYCHPNEDRIVLSHALFWAMSRPLQKALLGNKCLLLLRQYQEEMLDAYLTESDEYPELLRYCTIAYEALPYEASLAIKKSKISKLVRRLGVIATVAAGYGGDMPEGLACELLDDMDFVYNKVCCFRIELMLPQLYKMLEEELALLFL